MDNFEENKLKSIFVVLVTEQCWSGTPALFSNQNHKSELNFILLSNFDFGRKQFLILRGHWEPLKRLYRVKYVIFYLQIIINQVKVVIFIAVV